MWLGGYAPFADTTTTKLYRSIQLGVFEFHHEYWKDVSAEARNLISSLIEGMHIYTQYFVDNMHTYMKKLKYTYVVAVLVLLVVVLVLVVMVGDSGSTVVVVAVVVVVVR